MADPYPHEIPALEHTYTSLEFNFTGEGLYKDGCLYDAYPEQYFSVHKTTADPKGDRGKASPIVEETKYISRIESDWSNQFRVFAVEKANKVHVAGAWEAERVLNNEYKKLSKAAQNES